MFRRLIITAVATTGLFGGLSLTPNVAEAHGYRCEPRHEYHRPVRVVVPCRYEVYCGANLRGSYCTRLEADRCARDLRCHGFRVDVRCR
jgi:hypothetical protein